MYGEWMYAKHTVFYDALPHYFLEFDIYDRTQGIFLDTPSRRKLTEKLPIVSVPVLSEGVFSKQQQLLDLIGPSNYITEGNAACLQRLSQELGLDAGQQCAETDLSTMMEGLYLKIEEGGQVAARLKYVRASFLQRLLESESHWLERPIVPNQLAVPVGQLFEG